MPDFDYTARLEYDSSCDALPPIGPHDHPESQRELDPDVLAEAQALADVWAWAERFSDRVHTLDELARLRKQVHNTRNTCGSCTSWMTDSCPRERHDNRTGRKQGPSSMAINCGRFAMSAVDAVSVSKAEEKIATLRLRLQAA